MRIARVAGQGDGTPAGIDAPEAGSVAGFVGAVGVADAGDPKIGSGHTTTMTEDDDHGNRQGSVPGPQRPGRWGRPQPPGPVVGTRPGRGSRGAPGRGASAPAPQQRRRRWPWAIFIVLVLAIAMASRMNLNYYALHPGTAQSVQQFITVPTDKSHPVTHPVLLTDVEIGRVTALILPLLQAAEQHQPSSRWTRSPAARAPSQLNAQGNLEMSQAEVDAKAAALRRLGYKVPATPSGAVIAGTSPGLRPTRCSMSAMWSARWTVPPP